MEKIRAMLARPEPNDEPIVEREPGSDWEEDNA
jgi:hypothetical protein